MALLAKGSSSNHCFMKKEYLLHTAPLPELEGDLHQNTQHANTAQERPVTTGHQSGERSVLLGRPRRPAAGAPRLLVGTSVSRPVSALSAPPCLLFPCLLAPAALTEDGILVLGAGVVRPMSWHGQGMGWSLNGAITMTWVAHLNSMETSLLHLTSVSPTYDFARHWPACMCLRGLEHYPQSFGFRPRPQGRAEDSIPKQPREGGYGDAACPVYQFALYFHSSSLIYNVTCDVSLLCRVTIFTSALEDKSIQWDG